jgi:hypothetical protein
MDECVVLCCVVGTPVWTPYNRSPETDNMDQRKKYLETIKTMNAKVKEIVISTPSQFDEMLKKQLNEMRPNNNNRELFVLVTAEWCPDCQKGIKIDMNQTKVRIRKSEERERVREKVCVCVCVVY